MHGGTIDIQLPQADDGAGPAFLSRIFRYVLLRT
jgi:hypothetical protein